MVVKLVMFKANGQRKDFSLAGELTVIGRGENCDLRVPIESVSRRHCQLTVAGEQIGLKDLGSSNGTYLNNKRVTELALKAGDRLVVGPIVFTVQVNGAPEQIQQVKTKGQLMAESGGVGAEKLTDLVDEVVAQSGLSDEVDLFASDETSSEEGIDPISALEALASESDKENGKKSK